ncbi:hypothetical protein B9T19_06505 [Ignatzschineria sp. F8392]|uniref:hypothetical protein n=1 Tax=Ignatzschineria sp. F8392 TaxID=1980117 RepID=UPI000B990A71|nr:hypothetical protein [Ignatzschineria sp. F8392]OYQ79419.1 hypothetical protein B9T19_06505 [Ignatzschineria sp. F8392]
MDREIFYINYILQSSNERLTTGDISKKIFEIFEHKVSKKIVQNYLWSFFRNEINYNPNDYSYELANKSEKSKILNDISIKSIPELPRAINVEVRGTNIIIEYNSTLTLETVLKSLADIYIHGFNNRHDLIKNLNRVINSYE